MGITRRVWVHHRANDNEGLKAQIAIVGASGLRSVGKIVIKELIARQKPELLLELYSYGLPGVYYGPSYLAPASAAGVEIGKGGIVELPCVRFYLLKKKGIIIVDGYQAYNPQNQYLIADKVTDLLREFHVKRIFSLGAQVIEEGIRCCATDTRLLTEMQAYGIKRTNVDRFIGFSGLVTAMGHNKGIEGVCLFASTSQNAADPEYPDYTAASELLVKLNEILQLEVDTSILEAKSRVESKLREEAMREEEKRAMREKREREQEETRGYI